MLSGLFFAWFGDGLCKFIAMFELCFDIKLAGVRWSVQLFGWRRTSRKLRGGNGCAGLLSSKDV